MFFLLLSYSAPPPTSVPTRPNTVVATPAGFVGISPFSAIILLAGLQSIPDELYEQARIDGAGLPAIFRHVTLPLLKTVIIATLLFRTIDALRVFDVIYVLTGGGPGGSTTSVSLYAYRYYAGGDFGFGAAASVLLFITALVLALALVKGGRFEL